METQVVYHCVCFSVNIELWHLEKVLRISKSDTKLTFKQLIEYIKIY